MVERIVLGGKVLIWCKYLKKKLNWDNIQKQIQSFPNWQDLTEAEDLDEKCEYMTMDVQFGSPFQIRQSWPLLCIQTLSHTHICTHTDTKQQLPAPSLELRLH